MAASFVSAVGKVRGSRTSIFAGDLSKSPKYFPDVEHASLEIAGAAERDRTRMAKGFPKPLRALDRIGGTRAADGIAGHDLAIDVVARHDHELGDLGHVSASSVKPQSRERRHCLLPVNLLAATASRFDANQTEKPRTVSFWRSCARRFLPDGQISNFLSKPFLRKYWRLSLTRLVEERFYSRLRQGGILVLAAFLSFFPTEKGKALGYGAVVPNETERSAPFEHILVGNEAVKPEGIFYFSDGFGVGDRDLWHVIDRDVRRCFVCREKMGGQMDGWTVNPLVREVGSDAGAAANLSYESGCPSVILKGIGNLESEFCWTRFIKFGGLFHDRSDIGPDIDKKIGAFGIDYGFGVQISGASRFFGSVGGLLGRGQALPNKSQLRQKQNGLQAADYHESEREESGGIFSQPRRPSEFGIWILGGVTVAGGFLVGWGLCRLLGILRRKKYANRKNRDGQEAP
ncbi:hypothetical protein [Bradyrhizobium sp. AZCC 2289]|uniref:hypothetical protein n=1 Tax=Bradyrhizobium sp. AZCC 2289 TaxID=3117026 RepID=UPI002FF27F48